MANWFHNKIKFIGDDAEIKKAQAFVASEKGVFDLNKIKPMPADLQVGDVSRTYDVVFLLSGLDYNNYNYCTREVQERFIKLSPEKQSTAITEALQYYWNIQKYGHPTWYEWCIENWGTKWNVRDTQTDPKDSDAIYFDAADAPAMDALIELSRLFPKLKFAVDYFDPLSYRGSFNLSCGEVSDFIKEYSLSAEMEEELKDEITIPDSDELAEILNQPDYDFFEEEPEDDEIIPDEIECPECYSDELY